MRVLIVQKEEQDFQASKCWAFHSQFGWYLAAKTLGYDVDIYLTTFKFSLAEFLEKQPTYDVCICNCILHLFKDDHPSITFNDMERLRTSTKYLVGLTIEQVHYSDSSGKLLDFSYDRINGVNKYVKYFDAIGVFFSRDIDFFKQNVPLVFTIGPTIPQKYLQLSSLSLSERVMRRYRKKSLMIASIYGERKKIFDYNKKSIALGHIQDNDLQKRFSSLIQRMQGQVTYDSLKAAELVNDLLTIKETYFLRYIKIVRKYKYLLHPPAFFSGLHCRFIEAIVGHSICIHPVIDRDIKTLPIEDNIVFYKDAFDLQNFFKNGHNKTKGTEVNVQPEYATEYDLKRIISLLNIH